MLDGVVYHGSKQDSLSMDLVVETAKGVWDVDRMTAKGGV